MSQLLSCPAGHQWESAQGAACPVCGAVGRSSIAASTRGESLDTNDELPPRASSWSDDTTLRIKIPGYELLGELGRGGMGVVVKARQLSLNRLVAVKMIQPGLHVRGEELQRFRIEAEAVARLQNPNIVHIYEVGSQDGCPYLLLEYMGGGSLHDKVADQPQPPDQAAELVETLARAVHSAHQQGIIHRDLKPANVLLTTDGVPKIADFGLAKMLPGLVANADEKETPSDARGPTRSGVIMGTPSYMAPEQARGRLQEIGPATDVYSLGAILYDLLTGQPPFRSNSPLDTLHQVISQPPRRPSILQPGVPRELEAICLKCLEKDPAKRYLTAATLADALRHFRTGQRATGMAATHGRLVRWAAVVGLAVVIVIGLIIGYLGMAALLDRAPQSSSSARARDTAPSGTRPQPAQVAGNPVWTILRSLQETAPNDTFDQIAFPTRMVGYVAGHAGLYRTDDAGATWQLTWPATWKRVWFLKFADEQHGWLGADRLYETSDGGRHWQPVGLPATTSEVTAFAIGPDGTLLTAGATSTPDATLVIFRRAADQTKWESLPMTGPLDTPYRIWTASSMAFTSPRESVLVLYNRQQAGGVVLRTQDSGQSWTKVFEQPQILMQLHFTDAQHGWLTEYRGKLWRTTDGGVTWRQSQQPEGDRTVSALAFAPAPSKFGIAPLDQGDLLRTLHGETWDAIYVDLQGATPSAACLAQDWIYVLAADGRIARYADPDQTKKK